MDSFFTTFNKQSSLLATAKVLYFADPKRHFYALGCARYQYSWWLISFCKWVLIVVNYVLLQCSFWLAFLLHFWKVTLSKMNNGATYSKEKVKEISVDLRLCGWTSRRFARKPNAPRADSCRCTM